MKTLEEKADDYALKMSGVGDTYYGLLHAFSTGVTEALRSQWRRVEDELPTSPGEYIVAYVDGSVYTDFFNARLKKWCHYLDGVDKFTEVRSAVVAWQPFPVYYRQYD